MTADTSGLRIPATYVTSLLREFGDLLQDHGAPIDLSDIEAGSASGQTQIELLFTLIEALNERIGPEWPVKASFTWRNQMHGTIDVAARSAATLGEALEVLGRFGRVRAPFAKIGVRETSRERIFTYNPAIPIEDAHWQAIAEFMLLGSMSIVSQTTDHSLTGARIEMPDRSYDHRRMLEDALGVPITFGAAGFTMHFAKDTCGMSLPFRDAELFGTMVRQLEEEARRLSRHDWIVEDVRRLLARHTGERPNAQSIARELGMSQRSLVRKLATHGTSFREILDDHLKARAIALMAQRDLSSEEIAEKLGYRDRTSFSRAKRRWFGSDE